MLAQRVSSEPGNLSPRQRRVLHRARRLPFHDAVRLAADATFGFTHRAAHAKALWSDNVCVWLGRATFMHWAVDTAQVDIPRIVAEAHNAPGCEEELRKEVRAELMAYWADCLESLPPKSTPRWLPLP